jgi:hypothetical protein
MSGRARVKKGTTPKKVSVKKASSPRGKKLSKVRKGDCVGENRKWVIGQGCFEHKTSSPKKVSAKKDSSPRGKRLGKVRKGECVGENRKWVVGKGCFEHSKSSPKKQSPKKQSPKKQSPKKQSPKKQSPKKQKVKKPTMGEVMLKTIAKQQYDSDVIDDIRKEFPGISFSEIPYILEQKWKELSPTKKQHYFDLAKRI